MYIHVYHALYVELRHIVMFSHVYVHVYRKVNENERERERGEGGIATH